MKNILLVLISIVSINLYGFGIDTLILNSKITDVTVFFDGAQITRHAKVNTLKGKRLVVLNKLPAELNAKSIQIKNDKKIRILSVKHELIYPSSKNAIREEYEDKIKQEEIKLQEISNEISVYQIEEKILLDNSVLNKKEEGTTVSEIREASAFYREKLNEIRNNKLKLNIKRDLIKENIQSLYTELNKKTSKENKVFSKISFVIDAETAVNSVFDVSYFVSSAGWTPLYDFRVTDITEPLNIVYNANIFQSSGEDWNNVKLTLSTNRPSLSNTKPELATWFIERRNSYKKHTIIDGQSALKGKVTDAETGEPLPFVNISIYKDGSIITGATTDFDGRYSIKPIKSGHYTIKASYVGYRKAEIRDVILNAEKLTIQNFRLNADAALLEELEVVQYKVPILNKDGDASGSTISREEVKRVPVRVANSVSGVRGSRINNEKMEVINSNVSEDQQNITSLEYKIETPYSIPSDGNDYNVRIKEINYPVHYVYYSVPKLDKDVFLIAKIKDWTSLNLLSGKSSIYYQGTFTGQSEIDVNSLKDTLEISLNRDKNIVVERTLLKEKNEKLFIGKNIKEVVNWRITIKNNKNEKVSILVEDQFPISENKSIIIEHLELSNGTVNNKTGQVIWNLDLAPNEKKELLLKYSVRYPSDMKLSVE